MDSKNIFNFLNDLADKFVSVWKIPKERGEQMEVLIDSDTWTNLKEVANQEKIPMSVLATLAIKQYLEEMEWK